MKDPHSGDAPGGGASQGGATAGAGAHQPSAPQGGRKDGARLGNGPASASAAQHKNKSRKRRKRRGRKVYSREPAAAAAASPPVSSQPKAPQVQPLPQPAPVQAAAPPADLARRPPQPARPAPSGELPVFAALDLGTNNCRLLVAVPGRPGQFRVIDAFSRIVRLGEGLSASGRLGEAAMDRAVEALKVCADKLGNRAVRRARLIATEACRAAQNGAEFLDRVEAETGLSLEIIDRETEARLAVSGCGSLVERDTDGVVLFDIGGGSSEIALIDLSRQRSPRLASHIVSWTSLPVGVVSLAERFGGRDVSRESFRAMVDDVAAHLSRFEGRGRLDHMVAGSRFHLLGTSGTVTTLAGVHLGLERYDRRRVDGLWMDRGSVDGMVERLLGWEFHERVANPCIGADRADLVLAGCAILEAIREVWPSERLRVADRGLREGILSELMAEEGVWRRDRHDGWRR
ncbi:exopolyphosphatase / guanosine-5'-triphosphate,3'-diphosphate pyrophosphatase [Rhizobiaceae bacterium]|nr:exopolyphosphatase / guanosine-5'-triphosphate,3'-diphosphate pyrophosphatase [Rhizobiaceae bacterium]